ncbi:trypsin-like serine protease [Streptomyces flavidovirens]|uniref:Trypsin-like serine protease n=1 Tax=Streptomyces flavidovirens TaxID=67298 RepID=A0ABW6RH05_9ACTN
MSAGLSRRARTIALLTAAAAGMLTIAPAQAVTGTPAASGTYAFTARLDIGDGTRGCSGVLVSSEWLMTAASCFAENPAVSLAVPAGAPALKTVATIGRTDLTTTAGEVRRVVELVPRTDRDMVLARLNRAVTTITPITVDTVAPKSGEELQFAGFGRTATEWSPLKLHTGSYTVGTTATATATNVTGKNGTAACMGDTGGPVVRVTDGTLALAGITSQSYQGGCFGTDPAETRTEGVLADVNDLTTWLSKTRRTERRTDFNGDGVTDIAIADPKATVGTVTDAGAVRIVYGGGKGTAEITQDLAWVPGSAETGDWFGEALETVDYNEDGYTDLVVGTPSEAIGTVADSGFVDILYGARDGLGTGTQKNTHLEQGAGTGAIAAGAAETGDRMGHALAAGHTQAGEPYLVIGVPGEALGTIAKAGSAYYLRGTVNATVHQDRPDVPGDAETNDGFGSAVAADGNFFAIGAPNEDIGADAASGNLAVFSHALNTANQPTPLFGLDQDLDTVSGAAEANDGFGTSLALTEYLSGVSYLAVGSPGETLAVNGVDKAAAGRAVVFRVTETGTFHEIYDLSQGSGEDTVVGTSEAGDRFGEKVAFGSVKGLFPFPRPSDTRLAVGIPGEAVGTATKAGAVQTFALDGAAGDSDVWLEAGNASGVPGTPAANQYMGRSITFSDEKLYIGMPYGPSLGAVHVLPWANISGGTKAPVITHKPGAGGLPATGLRFGYDVE